MNLTTVRVSYIKTNCYILEKDNYVIVIDPGDEFERIMEAIGDKEIIGVVVTHYHPDHVGALTYFDATKVYDFANLKVGLNEIGPFKFEMIHTPGHKEDSITLYFEEDKKMFTGDFLFHSAIGRTDLPHSSFPDMVDSLKKISNYPPDVEIYPGHGRPSILGIEVENNKELIDK